MEKGSAKKAGSVASKPKDDDITRTINKIIKKANHYIDAFEYEKAAELLRKAMHHQPENLVVLDLLAGVVTELGDFEEAQELLTKIIELAPNEKHTPYFMLAQLHDGEESLNFYKEGIKILERKWYEAKNLEDTEEVNMLNRELSEACCAIAELYFTDLCEAENAKNISKFFIDKSITYSPSTPEGYQCLANYLLAMDDIEEAKKTLTKSLELWPSSEDDAEVDLSQKLNLSYQYRINTSKLLIELKMFDKAVRILDDLLQEDDEVVEVWFLLGCLNHFWGEDYWRNARYYLKKAKKLSTRNGEDSANEEIIICADRILAEMGEGSDDDDSSSDEDNENKSETVDDGEEFCSESEDEMEAE